MNSSISKLIIINMCCFLMWGKTIHVQNAIRQLGGNDDRPWLMLGDDKKHYVVKFRRNDNLPTIINEIFANKIAIRLKLPVPKMILVEIDKRLIDSTLDLKMRKIKPGRHIATTYMENSFSLDAQDAYANLDKISNLDQVPKFIIFDIMLYNSDRHEGNILLVKENGVYKYYLIDNGRIFSGYEWNVGLKKLHYTKKQLFWNLSKARNKSEYDDFLQVVESLSQKEYWDALNHIVDEFKMPRSEPRVIVDKLISDDQSKILCMLDGLLEVK